MQSYAPKTSPYDVHDGNLDKSAQGKILPCPKFIVDQRLWPLSIKGLTEKSWATRAVNYRSGAKACIDTRERTINLRSGLIETKSGAIYDEKDGTKSTVNKKYDKALPLEKFLDLPQFGLRDTDLPIQSAAALEKCFADEQFADDKENGTFAKVQQKALAANYLYSMSVLSKSAEDELNAIAKIDSLIGAKVGAPVLTDDHLLSTGGARSVSSVYWDPALPATGARYQALKKDPKCLANPDKLNSITEAKVALLDKIRSLQNEQKALAGSNGMGRSYQVFTRDPAKWAELEKQKTLLVASFVGVTPPDVNNDKLREKFYASIADTPVFKQFFYHSQGSFSDSLKILLPENQDSKANIKQFLTGQFAEIRNQRINRLNDYIDASRCLNTDNGVRSSLTGSAFCMDNARDVLRKTPKDSRPRFGLQGSANKQEFKDYAALAECQIYEENRVDNSSDKLVDGSIQAVSAGLAFTLCGAATLGAAAIPCAAATLGVDALFALKTCYEDATHTRLHDVKATTPTDSRARSDLSKGSPCESETSLDKIDRQAMMGCYLSAATVGVAGASTGLRYASRVKPEAIAHVAEDVSAVGAKAGASSAQVAEDAAETVKKALVDLQSGKAGKFNLRLYARNTQYQKSIEEKLEAVVQWHVGQGDTVKADLARNILAKVKSRALLNKDDVKALGQIITAEDHTRLLAGVLSKYSDSFIPGTLDLTLFKTNAAYRQGVLAELKKVEAYFAGRQDSAAVAARGLIAKINRGEALSPQDILDLNKIIDANAHQVVRAAAIAQLSAGNALESAALTGAAKDGADALGVLHGSGVSKFGNILTTDSKAMLKQISVPMTQVPGEAVPLADFASTVNSQLKTLKALRAKVAKGVVLDPKKATQLQELETEFANFTDDVSHLTQKLKTVATNNLATLKAQEAALHAKQLTGALSAEEAAALKAIQKNIVKLSDTTARDAHIDSIVALYRSYGFTHVSDQPFKAYWLANMNSDLFKTARGADFFMGQTKTLAAGSGLTTYGLEPTMHFFEGKFDGLSKLGQWIGTRESIAQSNTSLVSEVEGSVSALAEAYKKCNTEKSKKIEGLLKEHKLSVGKAVVKFRGLTNGDFIVNRSSSYKEREELAEHKTEETKKVTEELQKEKKSADYLATLVNGFCLNPKLFPQYSNNPDQNNLKAYTNGPSGSIKAMRIQLALQESVDPNAISDEELMSNFDKNDLTKMSKESIEKERQSMLAKRADDFAQHKKMMDELDQSLQKEKLSEKELVDLGYGLASLEQRYLPKEKVDLEGALSSDDMSKNIESLRKSENPVLGQLADKINESKQAVLENIKATKLNQDKLATDWRKFSQLRQSAADVQNFEALPKPNSKDSLYEGFYKKAQSLVSNISADPAAAVKDRKVLAEQREGLEAATQYAQTEDSLNFGHKLFMVDAKEFSEKPELKSSFESARKNYKKLVDNFAKYKSDPKDVKAHDAWVEAQEGFNTENNKFIGLAQKLPNDSKERNLIVSTLPQPESQQPTDRVTASGGSAPTGTPPKADANQPASAAPTNANQPPNPAHPESTPEGATAPPPSSESEHPAENTEPPAQANENAQPPLDTASKPSVEEASEPSFRRVHSGQVGGTPKKTGFLGFFANIWTAILKMFQSLFGAK